ncbi:MAG: hypothetical protein CM1200mP34_3600 [Verrucomicrobiales bacterium]|nr:MAG: hypothetical protein CM1200mP34_3600 [Verrucomicrobiales bacterium]
MYAYDVDGDGDNDVITSLAAHGYGLCWYENQPKDGGITFVAHTFMNAKPEENRYGVKFSQLHAIDLADINRDGLLDIVPGKRFWAHGPRGDAEPNAPAVLYWFELRRTKKRGVDWVPHLNLQRLRDRHAGDGHRHERRRLAGHRRRQQKGGVRPHPVAQKSQPQGVAPGPTQATQSQLTNFTHKPNFAPL